MKMPSTLLAAALTVGAAAFTAPAGAAPIAAPSSLQQAAAPSIETVQWRRGWRGRGWGWGPGIVAGAIVGGAIAAATQPWNYGYYDGYAYPGYYGYAPGYAYAPGYPPPATPMHPDPATPMHPDPATPPATAAATTSPIASSASAPTTRRRAPIWATTASAILVRDAVDRRHTTAAH